MSPIRPMVHVCESEDAILFKGMLQYLVQIKASPMFMLHSQWTGYSQHLTDGDNCGTVSTPHLIKDVYICISYSIFI
jgi:hypothetical protein